MRLIHIAIFTDMSLENAIDKLNFLKYMLKLVFNCESTSIYIMFVLFHFIFSLSLSFHWKMPEKVECKIYEYTSLFNNYKQSIQKVLIFSLLGLACLALPCLNMLNNNVSDSVLKKIFHILRVCVCVCAQPP